MMPPIPANTSGSPDFEGSDEELEGLLMQGLASAELYEEEFWNAVDGTTNVMLAARDASRVPE